MSADYKPGTVAKATVRGVPDVLVMAGYGTAGPRLRWLTTDARLVDSDNDGWYFAFSVTDVRPLVVLDAHQPERLIRYLRAHSSPAIKGNSLDELLQQVADQIESQTKPPKPPEPTNRYSVIVDSDGQEWLRDRLGMWVSSSTDGKNFSGYRFRKWADLDAVKVLSEGVS